MSAKDKSSTPLLGGPEPTRSVSLCMKSVVRALGPLQFPSR
jgi:hypothetical protein